METIIRKIGKQKQLFVDNWIVTDAWTAHRKIHQPRKHPDNPLLVPDKPWEGDSLNVYGAVAPRPGGGYRMWYNTQPTDAGWHGKGPKRGHYRVCYAESDDGIAWVKPNVGVCSWQGSSENNIVLHEDMVNDRGEKLSTKAGAQSFTLLIEPGPAADDGMLHGFSLLKPPDVDEHEEPFGKGGLCHLISEDGKKWYKSPKRFLLITGHSDTPNNISWNPTLGKYMFVVRPNVYANIKRRIAISLSEDLIDWTQSEVVLFPDEADPDGVQHLYGMGVFPYEGMWLGTLELYHFDGTIQIQLAYSRDGLHWERPPMRVPFIPWGQDGAFDHSTMYTSIRPYVVDDRVYTYYSGTGEHHGALTSENAGIGLASWRLDGFVSRSAYKEGWIVTRAFECEGERLFVNARVRPRGLLQAEVWTVDVDSGDQLRSTRPGPAGLSAVIAGYGKDDCVPFVDDAVDGEVLWGEGKDLAPFKGKVIRIKFHLSYTDLFAFRIAD